MRPISRTALGAATAAVLAVTAVAPSVAAGPHDDTTGKRPLVGSEAATRHSEQPTTVTLITGDRVAVSRDRSGTPSAAVLPREDGTSAPVQTRRAGDDLYVYPEQAVDALASGRVDEELFNVTGLIRQGYDDAHATSLPLIATYTAAAARSAPATPRGADKGLVLDAVNGVALTTDKKQAADFWADVTGTRSRSVAGLKKLWLDRKVKATLERSTKQVGADLAWTAGFDGKGTKVAVLDTGVDAEHPDLKGRVAAAENFTDSDSTTDRHGHGTHTISTVGGSGAASDGKKKGVAPGAELISGKVLNDYGSGAESWIIAGMQWAVDQKADVVSMSLGSTAPTDCTDPMSVAAEQLSRTEGTLFVVSAGNSGPALNTVSSPGCAPSVLTVGATDRDDSTARFSSRGPVRASHTLKPEIAAPGVAISAAAAGGRGVYAYRAMSGTSMAAPHVAGAAAVVKQRHPDWSGQQIKAALVSSAKSSVPGDVRETGAGRLDVKAAVDATVTGAPAVQGGTFNWPQDSSDRTSVEIPYTNSGDKPVTLDLAVRSVTGNDGSRVRSAVARLGDGSVTVPAGATVKVPLTLDPSARIERAQYGDVTGRVVATARGGVSVSTPFSLYVQPETVTLRVKLLDRGGAPAAGSSSLDVVSTDMASGERRFNSGAADQVYTLRPGSYLLSSFITSPDGTVSYLGRPQFELTKDTTVVLDARKAHRLRIDTDRASETRTTTLAFARSWDDTWLHAGSITGSRLATGFYADVQGRARDGEFEFGSYWRAYAPLIERLSASPGGELHPLAASVGSVNLDGTGEAEVVDAGGGSPAELEEAAVKGRFALVRLPDESSVATTVARNAKAAGALAVIVHRTAPGRWLPATGFGSAPHPVLGIEAAEAASLLERLAAGPVTLRWKATAKSPFVYNLGFTEDGPVTSHRTYRVHDDKLGRNEATYHAMGVKTDYIDSVVAYRPTGTGASLGIADLVPAPGTRTEYYTAGDTSFDHYVSSSFPWGEFMIDPARTHRAGKAGQETWYGGVITPVAPRDASGKQALAAERQGNLIGAATAFWGDSDHAGMAGSFGDIGNLRLTRDGEEIGTSPYPFGVFEVPAEEAEYELTQTTMKVGQPAAVWKRSTQVQTAWTFRSKLDENVYSQGIPLLFPAYRLPEDGLKTVAAKDGQRIALSASGHAGYEPAALTAAKVSYSYDGGETWTEAVTQRQGDDAWTATVNHADAAGRPVTLKTELTDARGNSVTQLVVDAYAVR
ncbi:S8 family serine peptidase [Streptomyces sp. NPDC002187]|uniref:S8 family serine peptidase n=1 Tax=Streptomyces sp. NPDC002187 TaxID=3364637 RepID=UPI0036C08C34